MTLFFEKPIPKQRVLSKSWQRQNKLNIYFLANHKQELYLSVADLAITLPHQSHALFSNKNYVWLYANERYVHSAGPGSKTTKKFFRETCQVLEKTFGRKIGDYESRYTEKFIFGDESLEAFCERNEVAYHWNHNCENHNLVGNAGLQFDCPVCGKCRMMTPEELVATLCKDGCLRFNEPSNHEQVYSLEEAKTALKEQGSPH